MRVNASGSQPVYQWSFNGVDVRERLRAPTRCGELVAVAGNYRVLVSNPCGTQLSSPAALAVQVAPVITQAGEEQFVPGAKLDVDRGGDRQSGTELSVVVQRKAILGATVSSYTVTNAQPEQAGSYNVVVSNGCGGV